MKTTKAFVILLILAGGCASPDDQRFTVWQSSGSFPAAIGGIPMHEANSILSLGFGTTEVQSNTSYITGLLAGSSAVFSTEQTIASCVTFGGSFNGLITKLPEVTSYMPLLAPSPPEPLTYSGTIMIGGGFSSPKVTVDGVVPANTPGLQTSGKERKASPPESGKATPSSLP